MVVKKKKSAVKKAVQKAGKKTITAKKNVKKILKKVVKKIVKVPAAKKAGSKGKIKNSTKKSVAVKTKPAAKKSQAVKKVAKKTKVVRPLAVTPKALVKKPETKSPVKKQITIEQRNKKMKEKNDHAAQDDSSVGVMPAPRPRKATTLLGALEFTPYDPKADETYMGDRQRDHFRKILDAWKQQLMRDVDLTVGHLKEEAVFYADPVDRASQEEGFNLELRTRDRERKLIKKIEQSLDLLNTGEYGFCEDCGAEIGIRRLEARPTAVKCIDCKTFQEIREKQLGG